MVFECWVALYFFLGRCYYLLIKWQMFSHLYYVLTDILSMFSGRSYCQVIIGQMLLPNELSCKPNYTSVVEADVIA